MKHTHLFKKTIALTVAIIMIGFGCSKKDLNQQNNINEIVMPSFSRQAVTLTNAGFESDTLGWGANFSTGSTNPKAHSGTRQARLTSTTRRVEQTVAVTTNTVYVLSAWLTSNGYIGARNGSDTLHKKRSNGIAADTFWRQVIDTFNTASYTTVVIFGRYGNGETRLDDFALDILTPTAPTALSLVANSTTSITLNWTDNSNDETQFRIEQKIGTGAWSPIATVQSNITTYTNTSLTENTKYYYRVRSIITGGNNSASTNIDSLTTGRTVNCSTASQFSTALSNAQAGDNIVLANGTYNGNFITPFNRHGTANNPITISGTRSAIVTRGGTSSGYGLHLKRVNYWKVKGIKVSNCKKGVVMDSCNYCTIDSIEVSTIGDEGIHLRTYSKNNLIRKCLVTNVGVVNPDIGEGIYVGSASANWGTYTSGNPDNCDNNIVEYNTIGPNVRAESIDVKEGTTGGIYRYNTFYSDGISGQNSADSWMDVKGNNNLIENNTGTNPSTETDFKNGFEVHLNLSTWGYNNTFKNNSCTLNRGTTACAVFIPTSTSGATICTNNTIVGAGTLSNQTTVSCP